MKRIPGIIPFFLLFVIPRLSFGQAPLGKLLAKAYPSLSDDRPQIIIIYLRDKLEALRQPGDPHRFLTERAIRRRLTMRSPAAVIDEADLPLTRSYVAHIASSVVHIRHELKWFNAVTAEVTKPQIEALRRLPFVTHVDLVGRWSSDRMIESEKSPKSGNAPSVQDLGLNYGMSLTQLAQINVPAVHKMGYYGQGVVIGVFDNGVRLPGHHAFDSMKIIATYDFVDHKVSIVPNNTATNFGGHGVNTLSTIGGYAPGKMIGPAFLAGFVLARTENDSSETPVEEDNWAKAIEWADSVGIDVSSTSLGYLTYNPPYASWTWMDMDGITTLITKAANRAATLGIVVVNSAGNNGPNASHNTLIAPADGDSVITAGAVDASGAVAPFSSVGPTSDLRIKPDIMAMGVEVTVASSVNPSSYTTSNGTSFSCPLSAGVAALIRCAHPELTPMEVRDAMRNTASNAAFPNNTYGWGILNAFRAIESYGAMSIGGSVFNDTNGDSLRESNEPLMAGLRVHLSGSSTDSMFTDSLGGFRFANLAAGNYSVDVNRPGFGGPASHRAVVLDSADRVAGGLDLGLYQFSSIHGTVFDDMNANGIYDAGDTLVKDWKLILAGPSVDSTFTDSLGNYSFENLPHGFYTVTQILPPGWTQTTANEPDTVTIAFVSINAGPYVFGNILLGAKSVLLLKDWNLLSVPQKITGALKDTLFPGAVSAAFTFNRSYAPLDTIENNIGFWLKFDSNRISTSSGVDRLRDSVVVHPGWNIIGSLSYPVETAAIRQEPENNIISSFYYYDGTYRPARVLDPWKGFWVKVKSDGSLILDANIGIGPGNKTSAPEMEK